MPFKETCRLGERIALSREHATGVFTVSELCRRHGLSRDTFYVWQPRQASGDARWFEARRHATCGSPHATSGPLVATIIATRKRFPHFGPKKIEAWLGAKQPSQVWPAASTIGDILTRAGLVEPRPRSRRPIAQGEIVSPVTAANDEWAIDFKGWFRTRDGKRCDPLTLMDAASRYPIEGRIVDSTWAGMRCALERVFETHGLPRAIRSDNGAPFGPFCLVAEAWHRAALHSTVEPARQWPARAYASHVEG